jgi:hypothetical protein
VVREGALVEVAVEVSVAAVVVVAVVVVVVAVVGGGSEHSRSSSFPNACRRLQKLK